MTTPALYTCARSRGLRATWAAEEAGVAVDLHLLPFPPRYHAPDYLALNPLGTVPLLVDGETQLTESCAIAHYLATRDGYTPLAIAPGEPDYGAYCDYTFHADATITFPQTVYMRFCLFEKDKGLEEAGAAYAKWFHKRLIKVEQRLQGRQYLCADRFTVADICVGYALILADAVGLDDGVPDTLKAYRARLLERPGLRRALAREDAAAAALPGR